MTVAFFDTNILVCAYTIEDQAKWRIATDLLDDGGHVSVQCLNEFASVARRKLNFGWSKIVTATADIAALCTSIVPITHDVHRLGLNLAMQYGLSVYDGLIVAAALGAGCDILYSEDMRGGLVVDEALTIRNPFA